MRPTVVLCLVLLAASVHVTAQTCLPTGVCLDPFATINRSVGNMPLAMALSPEGDRLVLSLNGWRQQGMQVIDRQSGTILQTISQPGAFLGLAFSYDGQTLYASGGNEDVIYRYAWRDKQATLIDTIVLAQKEPKKDGTRFPAGIAVSRRMTSISLWLKIFGLARGSRAREQARSPTSANGAYPYAVGFSGRDEVYVSAWGGKTVSVFATAERGFQRAQEAYTVGRHPSALLLNQQWFTTIRGFSQH